MKITELVLEQEQIDELSAAGVGQGIGKAAGSVVRGAGDFFKGLKQGYQTGKTPAQQPAATSPSQTTAAPSVDANRIKAQIAQKQKELKDLQSQLTKTEPGIGQASNSVSATATNTPAAQQTAQGVAPQAETPPTEPGIGQASNTVAATASNTPQPDPAQVRQEKQAAAAQAAQDQMAANPAQQPAATPQQAAAPAAEPSANKPGPEAIKQAQLKKNLMKNRQARTAAPAAPSGFAASGVGQARQRTYAGAGGAPKSYVVRENAVFYSKFLGKNI